MPITTPHAALPDLEAAVRTALIGSSAFTSICAGPFDPAPAGQKFPYAEFGEHTESSWYQFGNTGRQVVFMLHIYSQALNFDEAYSILDAVNGALETQTLTLTHFNMAQNGFLFDSATKLTEQDGITRCVVAKYRTWLNAK